MNIRSVSRVKSLGCVTEFERNPEGIYNVERNGAMERQLCSPRSCLVKALKAGDDGALSCSASRKYGHDMIFLRDNTIMIFADNSSYYHVCFLH